MHHYVCTGSCRTVSEQEGICDSADCTKKGSPLTECNCSDGNHLDVLKAEEKKQ